MIFAAADGSHADIVISARKETRKSIEEWDLTARRQPNAETHQILLGDVALKKMIGKSLLKCLRKGGIFHISRSRDNMRIHRPEALERKAVGLAGCHRLAGFVIRRRGRRKVGRFGQGSARIGFARIGGNFDCPSEFLLGSGELVL